MNRKYEKNPHIEVKELLKFLVKKGVIGFQNKSHTDCITHLVKTLVINETKNNDDANKDLTIRFGCKDNINSLLKHLPISEIIRIKYLNGENNIINSFFDSLTQEGNNNGNSEA